MPTADRPWWGRSLEEIKGEIEAALESHLSDESELTNRQKMLLRDAIAHAYRGLFGLAVQDIWCLGLPESKGPIVDPTMVVGVDRNSLRRALKVLRGSPPQWPPVFS